MSLLLPNGQIATHNTASLHWPILRLAFRPFFWLGALFSAVSICVWALTFTNNIEFSPYGGSYFWHAHEMLFGFAVAIIAGFLLTAVQTWTGVASIKGKPLAMLVFLWVLARIMLASPFLVPNFWLMAVDIAFLPMAALFLSTPIIKARQWRNLFFIPILLAMAGLNIVMHLSVLGVTSLTFVDISHLMVLMVTLVMCVMGGRVFPMFTANGTQTPKVAPINILEKLSIISVVICLVVQSGVLPIPTVIAASLFIFAAITNFIRALRWKIWVTFRTPLVWSLHLSYWSICTGLLMLGLAKMDMITQASLAYHAITVGGIGMMILSMISRVSLGHTGRRIQIGRVMTTALLLIIVSMLARVFAPLLFGEYAVWILLSAALWVLAYSLFVVIYLPVLFKSRLDGGEG